MWLYKEEWSKWLNAHFEVIPELGGSKWLKNFSGSFEQVAENFKLGVLSKWLKSFTEEYGASGCDVKFVVDGSKRLYE